jgi:hypothetical protein
MLKVSNIFSKEDIAAIKNIIDNPDSKQVHNGLGRLEQGGNFNLPETIIAKLTKIVKEVSGAETMSLRSLMAVEYNNKYGDPSLPPHFDGDTTEIIVDFQISSNTSWGIGLNLEVFELEDNSAVIFNPNTNIHWRPIKSFEDGEYVQMIFFRFNDPNNVVEHLEARYSQDHEVFREVREFRESL